MKTCQIRIKTTGELLTVKPSPWGWLTCKGISYSADEVELINPKGDM
jgi:hypothetical protein